MRKLVALLLTLVLCLSLSICAFATGVDSNQGGNTGGDPVSPTTGTVAIAVLAATACAAGGIGIISYRKSKEN